MKNIIPILLLSILVAGCLEELAPNPNEYAWAVPISGSTLYESDIQPGATEVVLTYSLPPVNPIDIDFNSHNVANCFTFGAAEAVADLSCFRDFFKEGENRLQVNHDNFGASTSFRIEASGPTFAIREVCYEDSTHCAVPPSAGTVDVLVDYRDASEIAETTLNGVAPYVIQSNTVRRYLVNTSDTYTFSSYDEYGAESTIKYKADGQEIEEIVEVRVDESFIFNIKDILGDTLSGYSVPYGDSSLDSLQELDSGTFGICDISVKAISLGAMEIKDIGITDDAAAQLTTDIDIKPIDPNIPYTYNNGIVENINNVGVDVTVQIRIFGFFCIAPINLGDMRIYIETMEVNADVDLEVANGKFTLELNDPVSTGENALVMIDLSMDDAIPDGLISWIMGLDFVRDLILGIVQNVINANLDEINISDDIETANGTVMRIAMQPESLYTQNNPDDNVGDMFIKMKGSVSTIIPDLGVRPALGSFYVNDQPSLPVVPDNGSALAVTVNSNVINQGLLAAYNIGVTHLTVLNGDVLLGPNFDDTLGSNGDFAVEMYPATPGQFSIEGDGVNKAYVEYNGAALTILMKDKGAWKRLFLIDVDIKAGVIMHIHDSKFYMTIAETPTFVVRKITDLKATTKIKWAFGTIDVAIKVDGKIIEALIEEAILFAIPYVAESELEIDVSKLNLPKKLTTETLSTEGGHLGFDMGVVD